MDIEITENQNQNSNPAGKYFTPYDIDLDKIRAGAMLDNFISRVSGLPEKIRFILTDFSSAEFVEEKLGVQFGLSDNQKSETTRIIRDVLLADMYIGDTPMEISRRLGIDQNTGREIANQIVSQLFQPALEDIKKMQAAKFPDRVAQQQASSPSQPQQPPHRPTPGADLPETGGNIIDLRNQK